MTNIKKQIERLNRLANDLQSVTFQYGKQQAEPFDESWRQDIKDAVVTMNKMLVIIEAAKKVQININEDDDCPFCSYDELEKVLKEWKTSENDYCNL